MAAELRLVAWLNRGCDPLAFWLHAISGSARVVGIDEWGHSRCAIWEAQRSDVAPLTTLSDAARWVEDGDDAGRLDAALRVAVGDAVGPRLLAVGDVARADRWARVERAARPDILCLAPRAIPLLPQPWSPGELLRVDPAGLVANLLPSSARLFARPEAMSLLDEHLLRQEALRHARAAEPSASYDAAELLALQGVRAPENGVAWTGPQRRAVLLLPGHGGGDVALQVRLADSRLPLDGEHLRFWLDGRELSFATVGLTLTLLARNVAPALCHRLEIAHADLPRGAEGEAPAGVALRSIIVERL